MDRKEIFIFLFIINVIIESTNGKIDATSDTTPDSSPFISNVSLSVEKFDEMFRKYVESQNKLFYSSDQELSDDSLMARCQLADIINGDCFTRLIFDSVCDDNHMPALIQGSTMIPMNKDIIKGAGLSVEKLKNMIKSGALTCIHNSNGNSGANHNSQTGHNGQNGQNGHKEQPGYQPNQIINNQPNYGAPSQHHFVPPPPPPPPSQSHNPQQSVFPLPDYKPNLGQSLYPISQSGSNSPLPTTSNSVDTNGMVQEMNRILLQLILHLVNKNSGENPGANINLIPNPCPSCTCVNCPRPNVGITSTNSGINPSTNLGDILGAGTGTAMGSGTSDTGDSDNGGASGAANPFDQLVNAIIGMEKLKFDLFRQKVNADAHLINHKINFDLNLIKSSANLKQALINAIVQSLNSINLKKQHDDPDATAKQPSDQTSGDPTLQNVSQSADNDVIEKQKNE